MQRGAPESPLYPRKRTSARPTGGQRLLRGYTEFSAKKFAAKKFANKRAEDLIYAPRGGPGRFDFSFFAQFMPNAGPPNRLKTTDLAGRAIIIHAGGDNYSDNPKKLGGGGARVACGVVGE